MRTARIAAQAGVRTFAIGMVSAVGAVGSFQLATACDATLLKGIKARSSGTYFDPATRPRRRCAGSGG